MIAYWFPPLKTVSLRSYFAYREFKKFFSHVQVITTSNQKVLPLETLPLDKKDCHPVFTYDYRTVLQGNSKNNQTHFGEKQKDGKFKQFFITLINSFPFNLLIGEGGFFYTIAGYWKARKLIKQHQITHIYSTFRPYSDHAIAYLLKLFYPQLVWIADYRDVHIDVNVDTIYAPRFQHWCNRQIMKKADLVTTVSKGLAVTLQQYHDHIYVLRNGFAELPKMDIQKTKNKKFQIVYTGSMFFKKRNPLMLLQVLQKLIADQQIDAHKIEIVYAGKDGSLWTEWLAATQTQQIFRNLGLITRQEALQLQYNAQINLLLTYSSSEAGGNLTGKFYEYLFAKSPILIVMNGIPDKEFEDIMTDIDGGELVYNSTNDFERTADFILKYYKLWLKDGQAAKVIADKDLAPFHWTEMMKEFWNHLKKI